jgi:hypothetical protein
MRKRGSIVCKWRPCLPKGPTNCTHEHHSDRSAATAIFANGTYFVDTPRVMDVREGRAEYRALGTGTAENGNHHRDIQFLYHYMA